MINYPAGRWIRAQQGRQRCRRPADPRIDERLERLKDTGSSSSTSTRANSAGNFANSGGRNYLPQRHLIAYSTKHDGLNPFLPF
jgi:hypothetical protein